MNGTPSGSPRGSVRPYLGGERRSWSNVPGRVSGGRRRRSVRACSPTALAFVQGALAMHAPTVAHCRQPRARALPGTLCPALTRHLRTAPAERQEVLEQFHRRAWALPTSARLLATATSPAIFPHRSAQIQWGGASWGGPVGTTLKSRVMSAGPLGTMLNEPCASDRRLAHPMA